MIVAKPALQQDRKLVVTITPLLVVLLVKSLAELLAGRKAKQPVFHP